MGAINSVLLFFNIYIANYQEVEKEVSSSINSEEIWALLILALTALAIVHMVLTFKIKRFEPVTVDEMISKRKNENKSNVSSEEEDELAMNYLNDLFDHWTTVSDAGEEELKAPTKRKHIDRALIELDKVKDIASTDPDVIDRMNELGGVVNVNSKRSFSGSKALIVVSLVLTIIMIYFLKSDHNSYFGVIMKTWWLWGSLIFYIVASYAPQFLIDKRLRTLGSSNFSSGLVGFFAGMFFAAPTFSTLTRYTDGTSSRSTDFNFFGLLIMLIGLMLIGMFIIVFGLLNYIRNFVLYF